MFSYKIYIHVRLYSHNQKKNLSSTIFNMISHFAAFFTVESMYRFNTFATSAIYA